MKKTDVCFSGHMKADLIFCDYLQQLNSVRG